MTSKVYGVYGRTEAIIRIPINNGKAYLSLEFRSGNISDGPSYRPATYVTCDPVEQLLIENSAMFKAGEIQLVRSNSDGQDEAAAESQNTEAGEGIDASATEYPDVTTIEGVRAVCKALGAKATTLANQGSLKKFIANKGISFPNFEF